MFSVPFEAVVAAGTYRELVMPGACPEVGTSWLYA